MKNKNAHLFEDPRTGILWISECVTDETGLVATASRELDFTTFKSIDAEYISYNHFGMCLAYDLITIRNAKGLYSVLTPFHATMGNGAIYASICGGFMFKSAYGFSVANPHRLPTIYVVAETASGKWGIIRIMDSNNVWNSYYDYDHLAFSMPQEIVPFEYKTMEEVLRESGLVVPMASVMQHSDNHGNLRDLTEQNVDSSDTFGVTVEEMMCARKYKKEQVIDPDADIFGDAEQHAGHWSEHKDLLHDKVHAFLAKLNAEAEAQEEESQEEASSDEDVAVLPRARANATTLRVTLPDGTIIQEKKACDTFIKAIQIADAYRVRDEVDGLILAKKPLISDTQTAMYDHRHKTHPIPGTNLFVNTQAENKRKKLFLEKISATLKLKWKVDLI